MTVSDRIAATLRHWGVRRVFGIPSGEVAHVVDALARHNIEFVLTKHENSAAFMADAQYRLTGVPGVVVAALGAGVTNGVTGVAQAAFDRSAVLFLSGAVQESVGPLFPRQIFSHADVYRPFVKWTGRVSPQNVGAVLRHVGQILLQPRPGPVHLDVPGDLAAGAVDEEGLPPLISPPREGPSASALATVGERLRAARRPVALMGLEAVPPGVKADVGRRFTEVWRVPAFTTYNAKGLVPEGGPWSAGVVGLSPIFDRVALDAVRRADLVLLVGLDPVELGPAWMNAWDPDRTVEVSREPGRYAAYAGGMPILADPAAFLAAMAEGEGVGEGARRGLVDETRSGQTRVMEEAAEEASGLLSPLAVLGTVRDLLPDDGILSMDTGAFRILATHVISARRPGRILQSSGLGTMAYGLPAGIAAQIVHPDHRVVVLTGDGGLLMCLGELAVAGERGLPLTVVVLVDEALALIELKQERLGLRTEGVRFRAPDFAALAPAFGGRGIAVRSPSAFRRAFEAALSDRSRFHLLAVPTNPREYWKTM